jgi:GcrA cell cycle regulator
MAWTDDKVKILKKLWSEGLSASQIANRIGDVTRNAVIGKVHRLGLESRAKSIRSSDLSVSQLKSSVVSVTYSGNLALKAIIDPINDVISVGQSITQGFEAVQISPGEHVTILTLNENRCKWPIGDPSDADFHFCGHEPKSKAPYCTEHSKVAFKPLRLRK